VSTAKTVDPVATATMATPAVDPVPPADPTPQDAAPKDSPPDDPSPAEHPVPPTATTAPWCVRLEDLSITYRTNVDRSNTIRQRVLRMGKGAGPNVREVKALRNVNIDVAEGTILGILGANGAGKSTLMRAVAGILPPTSGAIEIRGRVSTLLALGVGFNGNLTGRENVMLGGLAAGLSRADVRERYEEIAEFAELGDFMDMPMRTYSSGMYGRLAFAVAVHMEPDILLVDEALSAGDARFKHKSFRRMRQLMSTARSIFIVSHALGSIQELCNDAIWLHKGELVMRGEPSTVIDRYTTWLKVGKDAVTMEDV
jgi:ABC-type polysaccharide/polyol phosphate transport system ATPase subunit